MGPREERVLSAADEQACGPTATVPAEEPESLLQSTTMTPCRQCYTSQPAWHTHPSETSPADLQSCLHLFSHARDTRI